jgi:hypothetical protein
MTWLHGIYYDHHTLWEALTAFTGFVAYLTPPVVLSALAVSALTGRLVRSFKPVLLVGILLSATFTAAWIIDSCLDFPWHGSIMQLIFLVAVLLVLTSVLFRSFKSVLVCVLLMSAGLGLGTMYRLKQYEPPSTPRPNAPAVQTSSGFLV